MLTDLSAKQLARAARLRREIETKSAQLARILGEKSYGTISGRRKRTLSASHRAKIAAAKAAWWKRQKR